MPDRPLIIAHLTDLHLTAADGDRRSEPKLWGRGRGMNRNLRALVEHCRELQEADAIVVTGDVSDRGDIASWRHLHRSLHRQGLLGRISLLPGNHDVCCLDVRRHAPSHHVRQVRRALALLDQPTRLPWARPLEGGLACLFAVDTTNPGNSTGLSNAMGRIGEDQLVKLGRLLDSHRHHPVKIIALHHSPNIPRPATSRRRGERPQGAVMRRLQELHPLDRRMLRVLCRTYGVRAVLHGHTHDDLDRRVAGVRLIGAPATTEPDGGGHLRFKRYHISDRPPHRLRAELVRFRLPWR